MRWQDFIHQGEIRFVLNNKQACFAQTFVQPRIGCSFDLATCFIRAHTNVAARFEGMPVFPPLQVKEKIVWKCRALIC